jgi:histidine kinase
MIFPRPFFWPKVQTLKELPLGLLQVSLWGAITGPILGYFFVWLLRPAGIWQVTLPPQAFIGWLLYASRTGIMYVLVYWSTLSLATDYILRRYKPGRIAACVLYFGGWITAILLSAMISPFGIGFANEMSSLWSGTGFRVLFVTTVFFAGLRYVRLKLERAKAQKAAAEALSQVKALQAQINPHFFFNTLNTIYALIAVDPKAAQRTVGLLADMSRHAFATAQSDLIPLAQELDFANAYLEIEKVRFGRRLQCEMPDTSRLDGIRVPALVVQPLIENAIRHGISRRLEGGKVSVKVDRTGDSFSLTVKNECEASTERSDKSFFREGHALENIRQRLRLHYRDQAFLTVSFPNLDAVAVTITGPVQ